MAVPHTRHATSPILSARAVTKAFGSKQVLRGIELEIDPGESVCVLGQSGCGKSTFLRMLNGLESFDSGQIEIAGLSLRPGPLRPWAQELRARVGMVFQSFHLFPHLSLLENVRRAPEVVQKLSRRESERLALELLDKVGLSQEKNQMPFQLSGGQSQRGAIARALAMRPQVMLYDEPTSALDPGLVQEVLQVMRELKRERLTQVIVTHEMGFAKEVSDRILVFEAGRVKSDSTSIPEVWQ